MLKAGVSKWKIEADPFWIGQSLPRKRVNFNVMARRK
jgi:hypothetical protein